ncbi:MAG: hypothetical protein QOE83_355 [Actinomycetota bacterium]|jgi:hypothetical protein|nr:hypothetical protein [Actinomycetota bacterium]
MVEQGEKATVSPWGLAADRDISCPQRAPLLKEPLGEFRVWVEQGSRSLWTRVEVPGGPGLALRCAFDPAGTLEVVSSADGGDLTVEMRGSLGSQRAHIHLEDKPRPFIHVRTEILPTDDLLMPYWPRDLFALDPDGSVLASRGTIHATQRGLRSGLVYGSCSRDLSFLYIQDFSALSDYLEETHASPADAVGGSWPEMGLELPRSAEHPLPRAQEVTISDAYLFLDRTLPADEISLARQYLDLVSDALRVLPAPETEYRDWPGRAAQSMRDLEHSPLCSEERQGRRYLLPYVGDDGKPPESMVQLAVLRPLLEYRDWSGRTFALTEGLEDTLPSFFDEDIGCMRRWLIGEPFENKAEADQGHDIMDSWYLYYVLFSLAVAAEHGATHARSLLRRSLPYAIRVSKRFDYRWPVLFDLRSLDIVRQESKPGKGGEFDVGGLYALMAAKAYQLFDEPEYLGEAERALDGLSGLGLSTAYQTNTTAFAMQAALTVFRLTGKRRFLDRSLVCLASLVDNAWLWHGRYGHGRHYSTFFGIFPLQDAPYLAAYEEGELLAVFGACLELGGHDLPASARLLLSEYVRFALHRAWEYYPESLPVDGLATEVRNGRLSRSITIPVEDLQDGWELSGTVGQEVYGAGMALVFATRHFRHLAGTSLTVFVEYPIADETTSKRGRRSTLSFTVLGTRTGEAKVRLIPLNADPFPKDVTVSVRRPGGWKRCPPAQTDEGHQCFVVRGGDEIRINWSA